MNDTDPVAEAKYREMIMAKSWEERLMMGFSMCGMARRQAVAAIKRDNPGAGKDDIRKALFLLYYGQDFSREEQEKILNRLLSV